MADTAKIVERVADRFVKQLTNPIEVALVRARGRLSDGALVSALSRGQRAAERLVEQAVEDGDLRVLAVTRRPMEERLLDVAEESANATRCAVRPTGTGRPSASVNASLQAVHDASAVAARGLFGTDTVAATADIQRAISSTPLRIPSDLPTPGAVQLALDEAARVARFDATGARVRTMDIAGLRPTKPLRGDSELVVRYRQGLPVPPVVVTQDGVILDGHDRVASAWAAGLDRIPAVVVNSEQEAELIEWLRWNN